VEVSSGLTIVGLGPGEEGLITRAAWQALENAGEVYMRTNDHPLAEILQQYTQVRSFDEIYERETEFEAVYSKIVKQLLHLARRPEGVVYAVPGDPLVGEATVTELLLQARSESLPVQLIHGVSFIEPCMELLGYDALEGLYVCDALDIARRHHPPFPPDTPVLVSQLYSRLVASEVKLTLFNQYPETHQVILIHSAGSPQASQEQVSLFEIDQVSSLANQTSLFLPALPQESAFESFQETVARLRAPDGCPWDREQTHSSLRMHLLEEAYEALQALDREDTQDLREELGDLLLQIVLQAQIATEGGEFTMADVVASIQAKIISRHPHVFGELEVEGVDQVLQNWESLKAEERREKGSQKGALAGVPLGLPALAQADEIQDRAARIGFDWDALEGVIDKVREEFDEVAAASLPKDKEAEIGDLLFSIVNYARWLNVDPEAALRTANVRFRDRFHRMELNASTHGQTLDQMDLDELEALWQQAKDEEL
jgi:tetrapyrrole methylase family protein/MazG family protein